MTWRVKVKKSIIHALISYWHHFQPLKLVIPKKTESTKKTTAQRIAEMKSEAKVVPTSSVVYLGHIPHGFYERQLRAFFSQFGKVKRLRISRSHKTGKSRGYGFMEFEDPFVASIAAETMDNHRAFGRTLRCKIVPNDKQDERMWLGAKFNHRKYNIQNFRLKIRKLYNTVFFIQQYVVTMSTSMISLLLFSNDYL